MGKIPTGWLMLGSLAIVTIGFISIGFSISELLRQRAIIQISLLIFTCLGTILALVRGIGSLFPAIVVNALVFQSKGLIAFLVSASITSMVIFLGWKDSDDQGEENNKGILAYELLAGVCIACFGYFALKGITNVAPPRLIPIAGGLLGGFLSIFTELSNFIGLKPKQVTRLVTTLAVSGITIGLLINRLFPQRAIPL
jgi:hypothetical protein